MPVNEKELGVSKRHSFLYGRKFLLTKENYCSSIRASNYCSSFWEELVWM